MSELIAITRLIENGYVTHEPTTREPYDMLVWSPVAERYLKAQVKTVQIREDRENTPIIYARKNNGQPYTREEADVIIGVQGTDVFLLTNREIGEYWRPKNGGTFDWKLLPEGGAQKEAII
jgi:hypothetical protein